MPLVGALMCVVVVHMQAGVHLMSVLWEGPGRKGISLCMVPIWVRRAPLWSLLG